MSMVMPILINVHVNLFLIIDCCCSYSFYLAFYVCLGKGLFIIIAWICLTGYLVYLNYLI